MTTIQDAPARTFDVRSPASGTVAGTHPVHSARDVDAAVSRAHEAAEWWSALDYVERTAYIEDAVARGGRALIGGANGIDGQFVQPAIMVDVPEDADRIRAGGTSINAFVAHATIPTLPLGGIGASGVGRVHGPDGLKEFTYAKATTRQRFPSPLPLTTFGRGAGVDNIVDWLVGLLHGRAG